MLKIHPNYLALVEQVLLNRGYTNTWWQYDLENQRFGLVLAGTNFRIHVRGFSTGILDAHIEPNPEYFEHHTEPSGDANSELQKILHEERIPYRVLQESAPISSYKPPSKLTDWRPIVFVGLLAFALLASSRRG